MHKSAGEAEGSPLYRKNLGRPSFARLRHEAYKRRTLRLLKQLSNQHLANRRKQLAVFSYDLIGHRINLDGVYEGEYLGLLFDWLAPAQKGLLANGCAVDIGANVGNHTIFFAPFFRRVFSFEPNPKTFRLLQLNADLVDNVTCFNAGISDSDREGLLDLRYHNTGVSRISETSTADTVSIELKRLDSFVGDVEDIRLVKIDVEGHEAQVLRGSEATLRKHRPLVIFEQHKKDFANGTSESIDILKSYGYQTFAVVESFPPRLVFLPRVIRRFCQSAIRMLFGEYKEIRIRTHFDPQFYAFIIAIPDWAPGKT